MSQENLLKDMLDHTGPGKLIKEHFDLLEQKREIEHRVSLNSDKTAKLLASNDRFDLLSVNWAKANQIFRMRA